MLSSDTRSSLAYRTDEDQALLDGFLVKPVTGFMLREAAVGTDSATARLRQAQRAGGSARRLTGLRILVVEDNLINQQVAEELLMSEGATVLLAANGRLGVDAVACASPQFDAVLMDIQMPVMDGYAATQAIRQQLGLATLPIVAMTANAMASDREDCLAAGMTEHIGKPFDLSKLVQLLLRLTGHIPASGVTEPDVKPPLTVNSGDEIDSARAIARMSGLKELYLRSAKEFALALPNTVDEWLSALAHDPRQAVIQMHSLKGTAALVGAERLSLEAARLEKLCHVSLDVQARIKEAATLSEVVRATQDALHTVIVHLSRLVEHGGYIAEPAPRASALQEALRSLVLLLQVSDLTALELFAQRRSDFELAEAAAFSQLEEALQGLELQQALAICQGLLADW
jgi:CheY-like chemotaxis protein